MVAHIQVLQEAQRQIQGAKGPGLLVGLRDGGTTLVTGVLHCEEEDLRSTKELAGALLPPPLAVVGCCGPAGAPLLAAHTEPNGVAAAVGDDSVAWSIKAGGVPSPCQPELVVAADVTASSGVLAQLEERYTPIRCCAELVVSTSGRAGPSALAQAFDALEEQLCGPASVYVVADATGGSGGGGTPAAAQPSLPGVEPFAALGASWSRVPVLRPYERTAAPDGCAAPRLSWTPASDTVRHASLALDVLAYVPADMAAAEAVGALVRPAVRRQLRAMRTEAEESAAAGAELGIPTLAPLRALHFQPPGFAHHITLIYPLPLPCIEADEEALLPRRRALHRLLGLPPNRPLLRAANAADFSGGGGGGGLAAALLAGGTGGKPRLQDVHVGLPPPPVGSSVHLVQGSYDYFHYMQDRFDDSGWGCAYRSLQTICSWFARQGYAARPPPGHREIQSALVAIGDKDPGFIGSKQWIGAIELGFILDSLLGVSHRVLTVQSGDDMPSLAREIGHHFDTQGTPIMIGGGVLAYTLLGVDFDERSGRCAFLILDPHYTGAEDLKKIHAGTWVAWKQPGDKAAAGGDLFVSGSFYNLLCPQRPTTV